MILYHWHSTAKSHRRYVYMPNVKYHYFFYIWSTGCFIVYINMCFHLWFIYFMSLFSKWRLTVNIFCCLEEVVLVCKVLVTLCCGFDDIYLFIGLDKPFIFLHVLFWSFEIQTSVTIFRDSILYKKNFNKSQND